MNLIIYRESAYRFCCAFQHHLTLNLKGELTLRDDHFRAGLNSLLVDFRFTDSHRLANPTRRYFNLTELHGPHAVHHIISLSFPVWYMGTPLNRRKCQHQEHRKVQLCSNLHSPVPGANTHIEQQQLTAAVL